MTATDLVVTADMVRAVAGLVFDTALPASIAHELNGMADQLELEQRDVAGEEGPVLSGDPVVVEKQLDALPVGSIVATLAEGGEEPIAWQREMTVNGTLAWYSTGFRNPWRSLAVARSGSLEVLR